MAKTNEYGITDQEKVFADAYILDPSSAYNAAIKAGYAETTARSKAGKWLKPSSKSVKVHVLKYVEMRNKELEKPTIATMTEVKEFWTTTMRNPNVEMKDRLKSSENLAKASGEFMEKVEHSGNIGTTINIIPASKVKKDG